jgi:poly-gamma-glutamate synthase PgsB/CapB
VIAFAAALAAFAALAVVWRRSFVRHRRTIDRLAVRVHVNGIRGKSSVTRLVAAVLREGGYVTVAKTTGSAARVIGPLGDEEPIRRRGAATIIEQLAVIESTVGPDVDALVIECMAVNPRYQRYSQEQIVRSDITVITNVREDHQEQMGESLAEIADALAVTIPRGGILVTAEDRPELRARLARRAAERGAAFVAVDEAAVGDDDMDGFDHVEFRANVAIGVAIGELLGIERTVALRGMRKAVPDVGALRIDVVDVGGKEAAWIPLFAANDRESVLRVIDEIRGPWLTGRTVVGILNNRWDRGRRAELFADMVPTDLGPDLDHVVTFGAYEAQVTRRMIEGGFPADRIANLGESVAPTLDEIIERLAALVPGDRLALVGLANIHTPQAELLIHHFEQQLGAARDGLAESRQPRRWPTVAHAVRHAAGRRALALAAPLPERGQPWLPRQLGEPGRA